MENQVMIKENRKEKVVKVLHNFKVELDRFNAIKGIEDVPNNIQISLCAVLLIKSIFKK